jgi:hypothetical protein
MSFFDDNEARITGLDLGRNVFDDRDDDGSPRSANPYCRYCECRDVEWIHTGVRWRLYNVGGLLPHRCVRVASVDDFEVLP